MKPRYQMGQQYLSAGKHPRLCIVTDIFTTTNYVGEVVKIRYQSSHTFMGQVVTDDDVTETTVAIGIARMEESKK